MLETSFYTQIFTKIIRFYYKLFIRIFFTALRFTSEPNLTENVQLHNPIKSQLKVFLNLVTKANLVGFLFYLTMVREHDMLIHT